MKEFDLNPRRPQAALKVAALCAAALLICACHKSAAPTAEADDAKPKAAAAKPDDKEAGEPKGAEADEAKGVTLTPEQMEKLGVVAKAPAAAEYRQETPGYGVVVPHETLAQAVAELTTAEATAQQSRAALARTKRLAGTPGAVSADVEETAARQAAVDEAALTLTNQRLASIVGMRPPWKSGDRSGVLRELAAGQIKLVRVTFPLGTLSAMPSTLRATHISGATPETGWKLNSVWEAPADANVPGRSFFALLKANDAGEGERLMVFAPVGAASKGVIVPAAAVVLSESHYWCYLEKDEGHFVRTPVDTARPTADGYFVTSGFEPDDKVVTAAAGLLLAKETNSGAEPD
jgi:hypothetical protein